MKFGDKLLKLRKLNGMSQEDLAEKLNVTRQAISKWELEQSKPDMGKFLEISKLFKVDLEILTNDNLDIDSKNSVNSYVENKTNNSKQAIIIISIIFVFFIVISVTFIISFINIGKSKMNSIWDMGEDHMNSVLNVEKDIYNNVIGMAGSSNLNNILDTSTEYANSVNFNTRFEAYKGIKGGFFVKVLLNDVFKNNKDNERIITVKYKEISTSDPYKIYEIRNLINDDTGVDYEVELNYDKDNYVYEIEIKEMNK